LAPVGRQSLLSRVGISSTLQQLGIFVCLLGFYMLPNSFLFGGLSRLHLGLPIRQGPFQRCV
jgi:hypothetical protein